MGEQPAGIRVIDVTDLGCRAILVEGDHMTILLMDGLLTCDQRMAIMADVMPDGARH